LNHAYEIIFQLFKIIWLMFFIHCFLKDLERNFLERFFSRIFVDCIWNYFSTFQNYLVNVFYGCFFKGHGEKLFGRLSPMVYARPWPMVYARPSPMVYARPWPMVYE
jgi:hypothetical protein